jgi:sterol desaturase/sphingolipid hydroxylase (fatty acid hydroxylase superfamily)
MMRHLHMLHHFHNEKFDFGVTTPIVDVLFGTFRSDPALIERSPTVNNLGYSAPEALRYPWLAQLEARDRRERTGSPQ